MRRPLIACLLLGLLVACGKGAPTDAPGGKPGGADKPATALLLAPEDMSTVGGSDASLGPVISGSIQPERRADLRAEIGAVVQQVL